MAALEHLVLDDFPGLIGNISSIYYHGKGRGGGEKVAIKLHQIFERSGSANILISHRECSISDQFRECLTNRRSAVLFTSGVRDLIAICISFLVRRPFFIFLQVPVHESTTLRDWRHTLAIYLFLLVSKVGARAIIVNSSSTALSLGRVAPIVLPITREDIALSPPVTLAIIKRSQAPRLYTVCRLFTERGAGSRDIGALLRLGEEMAAENINLDQKRRWKLVHIGDVAPEILRDLEGRKLPIEFRGYIDRWEPLVDGPLVFLSRYEGFGLAAFEAAKQGLQVYVNEAFPRELFQCCPNIERIRSSDRVSILRQITQRYDNRF